MSNYCVCICNGGKMITLKGDIDSDWNSPRSIMTFILYALQYASHVKQTKISENFCKLLTFSYSDVIKEAYEAAGSRDIFEALAPDGRERIIERAYKRFRPFCDDDVKRLINTFVYGDFCERTRIMDSPFLPANSNRCKYGYVIDLDNGNLEVYYGMNREPVINERFSYLNRFSCNGYYPLRFLCKFPIDSLPDSEQMYATITSAIDKDSNCRQDAPDGYPRFVEYSFGNGQNGGVMLDSPESMKEFIKKRCMESLDSGISMEITFNGIVIASLNQRL